MTWLSRRVRAGLRRRRGAAVLLALLAATVAVVAATTPILLRVVEQAALDHALAAASPSARSVVGDAATTGDVTAAGAGFRAALVPQALGDSPLWTPVRTLREEDDDPLQWPSGGSATMHLADVADCAPLRFTAGRCPVAGAEAAVADSTFRRLHVHIGQRVPFASAVGTVTIVGAYDATTAAGAVAGRPGSILGVTPTTSDPDLLVTPARFDAAKVEATAYSYRTLSSDVPLGALPDVRAALARAIAVPLRPEASAASTNVVTSLGALLDRVDQQVSVVSTILDVVAACALGLCWLASAAVAQRLARVRAKEWALPRLRGMRRARRLGVRLAEPVLAVVLGTAVGAALAAATPVAVTGTAESAAAASAVPEALAFAATASLVALATLVAVAVAADRRPLEEQLRRSGRSSRLGRLALIAAAAVVVGAIASVAALVTAGTQVGGAGLLAPVLGALAIGFVVLQSGLAVVRRRTRSVPRSLTALVVWRRLGRSPSQTAATVLLAAAISLSVFVALTAATADGEVEATSAARIGAQTVLHVRLPPGTDVLAAADRADPDGHRAMAAAELVAGTGVNRVVAVDTARLEAVSTWRSAWAGFDAAELRSALAPAVRGPLSITGTRITARIAVAPVSSVDEPQHFALEVQVQGPHRLLTVPIGAFLEGESASLSAPIPCAAGCTLGALTVRSTDLAPRPWRVLLTLSALSTDVQPPEAFRAALADPGGWIPETGHDFDTSLPLTALLQPGASGLQMDLRNADGGGSTGAHVSDTIEPLPAIMGAATTVGGFPGPEGTVLGTAVDKSYLLLHSLGRASAVPRLLGDGVLVDLRRMLAQSDRASGSTDDQIWVRGPAAPIERRLRAQGVAILRAETLAADVASERAAGGPVAARSAMIGAVAAALAVLVALIGARLLTVPDRRRQWRSFASAGIRVPQLRRLVAIEFGAPALIAVLVGALSGAAVFVLALPHLPLADAAPDAPPAGLPIPWTAALAVPLAAALAVLAAALVVARAETAGATRGGAS